MSRKRVTVAQLANEAGLDEDEALITLWDSGFGELTRAGDRLARGEANRARRVLGLATRREVASIEYWRQVFDLGEEEFRELLDGLGVHGISEHGQLPKKAIHRLRAEAKARYLLLARPAEVVEQAPSLSDEKEPGFELPVLGHERDMAFLSEDQVLAIHYQLVEDFARSKDPLVPPGLRSEHLLASALHRPTTQIGGRRKYPTVEMGAAAMLHGLVHNHPFHNGNKRTGLVAMLVFLDLNGFMLLAEEDELFKLVLRLAQHALVEVSSRSLPDREVLAVTGWLHSRVRMCERGDRPLQWRRLKRILGKYGCEVDVAIGGGNKARVTRRLPSRRSFLGIRISGRRLQAFTWYGSDGSELDKIGVSKLRHDLELDDEHGIDSASFYDDGPAPTSDFIVRYRKTLTRLARL